MAVSSHVQNWFSISQLDPEFNLITNELLSGSNGNQFWSTAMHTKYRQHSSVHSHHTRGREREREREETLHKICKLYLYLMYRFFTWTDFGKLIEFQVTFFQSVYIWLIQTKLVLSDNRATKFHQSHSAVLEMKHANKWTLHAHYTFFFSMDFKSI